MTTEWMLNNIFLKKGKREKIYVNGFKWWLDREKLMLYEKENSTANDGTYLFSQYVTKDERRQIINYMKFGR